MTLYEKERSVKALVCKAREASEYFEGFADEHARKLGSQLYEATQDIERELSKETADYQETGNRHMGKVAPEEIMEAIRRELDGQQRNADSSAVIAQTLRTAGHSVREVELERVMREDAPAEGRS